MKSYSSLLSVLLALVFSISTVYAGPAATTTVEPEATVQGNGSDKASKQKLEKKSARKRGKKLTRKQRKEFRRDLKEKLKKGKDVNGFLLIIIAILIPPLAVALFNNAFDGQFWLCLLLTLLFYLPGLIYALIVITG